MQVKITLPEEAIWAARWASLFAMLGGDKTNGARVMVRELFRCMSDILPDDLGVEITVSDEKK